MRDDFHPSPTIPPHEPQGTRREEGYHSHPSSSILLPVEGRRKKPADVSRNIGGSGGQGANLSGESLPVEGRGKSQSSDLGKLGVHGPDARPFLEVEAPHEPGGPSPHPGPLPSHPMGAERESAFAKATADRWQANANGRLKAGQNAAGSGVNARNFFRGVLSPLRGERRRHCTRPEIFGDRRPVMPPPSRERSGRPSESG